jgi:excisionase family DNA binding protein
MLINYKKCAELLDVPLSTLYSMVCRKRIPFIRLSGRSVRFDVEEIQRWLDERRIEERKEIEK